MDHTHTAEPSVTEWLDHPIVSSVRSQLPTDHSVLDVLEATLRVMHELDDRFPGATTSEILRSHGETPMARTKLRERMLAAGADPKDVAIVAPLDEELAAETGSTVELAAKWGMPHARAREIVSYRRKPTDEEREAAALRESGVIEAEVQRRTGRSQSWVRHAVGRVRYDRLAATLAAAAAWAVCLSIAGAAHISVPGVA